MDYLGDWVGGGPGQSWAQMALVPFKAGLALKNPPKKTHPKKPTQKNPKKPT